MEEFKEKPDKYLAVLPDEPKVKGKVWGRLATFVMKSGYKTHTDTHKHTPPSFKIEDIVYW